LQVVLLVALASNRRTRKLQTKKSQETGSALNATRTISRNERTAFPATKAKGSRLLLELECIKLRVLVMVKLRSMFSKEIGFAVPAVTSILQVKRSVANVDSTRTRLRTLSLALARKRLFLPNMVIGCVSVVGRITLPSARIVTNALDQDSKPAVFR